MRTVNFRMPVNTFARIFITCIVGLGIFAGPSVGQDQPGTIATSSQAASVNHFVHGFNALTVFRLNSVEYQDAAQSAPPPAAPAPTKKVELPEGNGKPIATEYCQDCHRLTNMTNAHKTADEWRDTVQLMMDRGARLPEDQIDTLVPYLAKNFGPVADTHPPATAAPSSPAPDAQAAPGPTGATPPNAPAQKNKVELPEGDGKAIATEYCQDCHRLNNLMMARKNSDEWNDTVHLMMDRGARLPDDKVDTLVQYLAKNLGPKGPASPGDAPSSPASPSK